MAHHLPFFPLIGLSVLVLTAACGKSSAPAAQQSPPAPVVSISAHMPEHLENVRKIEEALIRGDVEGAKAPARWIADHQESAGLTEHAAQKVVEMKAAARSVASTGDVGNAAIAAATLVGACGSCHAASKAEPKFPELPPVAEGKGRAPHMLDHQRAIDQMYRGLIAPASDNWRKGAQAFKAAPLGAKGFPEVPSEAAAAEARAHELADRALDAPSQSSRVTIYGSLVGACASCHGLHGSVWGPGLSKTN